MTAKVPQTDAARWFSATTALARPLSRRVRRPAAPLCKGTLIGPPRCSSFRPAALLIAAVIGLASAASAATDKADSWDTFRVLVERNMFLRDRRLPRPPRSGGAPPPADSPDRRLVLTGTALCGSEFVAFFEDIRTGKTLRARVGGAVGTGKLKAVALNGVEYETGGKATKIEIGWSLLGEAASLPSRRTSTTAEPDRPPAEPETTPETNGQKAAGEQTKPASADDAPDAKPKETASPGGADNVDIVDILQRMRQRREEELKK
jgi:hypothetical protein